ARPGGDGSPGSSKPPPVLAELSEATSALDSTRPDDAGTRGRGTRWAAAALGVAALVGLGLAVGSWARSPAGLEPGSGGGAGEGEGLVPAVPTPRGAPAAPGLAPARPSAPRAASPSHTPDPRSTTLAVARQLLQVGGPQSPTRSAAPRDRLKSVLEELTSVV